MKVNRDALMQLLKETGQESKLHELKYGKRRAVRLKRTDIKEIEGRLTDGELVVLRASKLTPGNFEFVNEKYATIAPRRHFEKHPPKKSSKQAATPAAVMNEVFAGAV